MKKITVIGGGPGNEAYILPAARQKAAACDRIAGDRRILESFGISAEDERVHVMDRIMETMAWIGAQDSETHIGILVSGDPMLYSLYRMVVRTFPAAEVDIVPGISSVQAFAARLGEAMEDARLVSGHGRNLSEKALAEAAAHCPKLFILCDKERTPAWIAGTLVNSGLKDVRMAAGSFLTYPEEKILSGKPEAFLDKTFGALSLALVKNDRAVESSGFSLLEDQQFSRNKTPMTREEVRWIILGKLRLSESSVLWDIGAGTGSVSVEAALRCRAGKVIAVERNPQALAVLRENSARLAPDNMEIVEGNALEVIDGLAVPTHVFIGGAGGVLKGILKKICGLGPGIRILISCVTLETLTMACELCRENRGLKTPEVMTVRIEHSRPLGSYHVMEGAHPVTLVVTETTMKQEKDCDREVKIDDK